MSKISLHYLKRKMKNIEQNSKSLGRSGLIGRWQTMRFFDVTVCDRNAIEVFEVFCKPKWFPTFPQAFIQYLTSS